MPINTLAIVNLADWKDALTKEKSCIPCAKGDLYCISLQDFKKKYDNEETERSLSFFKQNAKKYNVKYQTMINEVLDTYSQKYASKH